MKKYLIYSFLVLFIINSNSLMSVSALDDGTYFSSDLQKGDVFEWKLSTYINDYKVVNVSSGVIQGSVVKIEIIQSPINIELGEIYLDFFSYFQEEYDGLVVNYSYDIIFFIVPTRIISGGVEVNSFIDEGLNIDGDITYVLDETTSGDEYHKHERRYNKFTGVLQFLHRQDVYGGEVYSEVKWELLSDDGGLFGLDFSSFWFILPALMIPVIIKRKK